MTSEPLVSIITPAYNQAEFIEDNLTSVCGQDYPNIEHIVVDGDSTDETTDILEKYESEYNLRWVSEPDQGQSSAVNKGFKLAEGDIIGWLNSDDVYFDKEAISNVVENFTEDPEVDIVYGNDVFLNQEGAIIRGRKLYDWDFNRLLRWGWWGWTPASEATFYRKEVVENQTLDESLKYVLDFEYFLRLGRIYEFDHIDCVIAGKRKHSETKSSNRELVSKEASRIMEEFGFEFGIIGKAVLLLTLIRIQMQWILSIPLVLNARKKELSFDAVKKSKLRTLMGQLPLL